MTTDGGVPTLSISDGWARLRLNRPEKRNRVEPADIVEIIDLCQRVTEDASIRVLTVESEGPVWCAGYHLGALADGERPQHGFGDACDTLAGLGVPTVAVLSGTVHGGGTDLALSCDLRVAIDETALVMPAARIGIQYYASGLQRFVRAIGPAATKRLFLTAERISADELLRIGYLTETVPANQLADRVEKLVGAITALAPLALRRTKWAIDELMGPSPDIEAIEASQRETLRSEDHREAMAAMRERRAPRFTGR